jgi:hypothetical protein
MDRGWPHRAPSLRVWLLRRTTGPGEVCLPLVPIHALIQTRICVRSTAQHPPSRAIAGRAPASAKQQQGPDDTGSRGRRRRPTRRHRDVLDVETSSSAAALVRLQARPFRRACATRADQRRPLPVAVALLRCRGAAAGDALAASARPTARPAPGCWRSSSSGLAASSTGGSHRRARSRQGSRRSPSSRGSSSPGTPRRRHPSAPPGGLVDRGALARHEGDRSLEPLLLVGDVRDRRCDLADRRRARQPARERARGLAVVTLDGCGAMAVASRAATCR